MEINLRRIFFAVLVSMATQLTGCGSDVELPPIGKVTHIEISRNDSEPLARITDEKQVLAFVAFADSHRTGWGAPWGGVPVPKIVANFYDGKSFKGHLGVGSSFFETQRQGGFWSQSASPAEIENFFALAGVNEKHSIGKTRPLLAFKTPQGWEVSLSYVRSSQYFILKPSPPDGWGSLGFTQRPFHDEPEDISILVKQRADDFLKNVRSYTFTLISQGYSIEQFAGGQCQGSYVTFQTISPGKNGLYAFFVMSVDGEIWEGLFCGPEDTWKQTLGVLTSIKKNGLQGAPHEPPP